MPQLWQSREAVAGLAKQRSAKIKHAAGEGFLAVRGLGISCGSRADLVQISCQPSVYSVVSSMSKSLSLLSSLSLSLSLLCSPLLSINSLFNCRRRHNILGPTQALRLTYLNSEKCCSYNRDTTGLKFSSLSFFFFFSTSIVSCTTCNIFGKRFRKIKPLPVNETHNSCGANRICLNDCRYS